MRFPMRLAPLLAVFLLAACDTNPSAAVACCSSGQTAVRVVNAFTGPVDLLIDGTVAVSGLAAGVVTTTPADTGTHTLVLRPAGSAGPSISQLVVTPSGGVSTIAAVRASSGLLSSAVLDDTNSVVPAGATKVRVLHLAPNAGTLQVYRTQPDYQTPVPWQVPFTYQPSPTSFSAPFYQSTAGTWEIRVWQTPPDASGWANAPVKVVLPLLAGEKRTILILDSGSGGVRTEVL